MQIKGFVPTSFVDWDGKVSSVVFLSGCNFRCVYCYNIDLILYPEKLKTIEFITIKKHLLENKGLIDGVVLLGGEPTIHNDLPDLAKNIKALDIPVKLDTNGSNPDMIQYLLDNNLIDYVAMDIKAPLNEKYSKVTGVAIDLEKIKRSIDLLINSNIDYEFRSTILPSLHSRTDVIEMAKSIKGAKRYFLQQFKKGKTLNPKFENAKQFTKKEFESIKDECNKYVSTKLRI